MEKDIKKETELTQKIEKIEEEIQPALYAQSIDKSDQKKDAENELNAEILQITMTIKDKYPELAIYINEMPVTIPDEKNPEINHNSLRAYRDSLKSMLSKYILEQQAKS